MKSHMSIGEDLPFGLAKEELSLLKGAILDFCSDVGLSGEKIFSGLVEGQAIHETLGLDEQAIDVVYGLAYQHLSAGHLERAERLFGVLTLLKPGVPYYWLGFSMAARAAGKNKIMFEALDVVKQIAPDWAVLHFHLLEIYCEARDWVNAKESLNNVKRCNTDGLSNYMLEQMERYERALVTKP